MALSPAEMHASILKNIPERTGRSLVEWMKIADGAPAEEPAAIRWLMDKHDLGRFQAQAIVRHTRTNVVYDQPNDLVDELFPVELRGAYDKVDAAILRLGTDVERVPCKTYVGYRVAQQFAVLRARKGKLQLGLALGNVEGVADADLDIAPGGFGSRRITHAVELGTTMPAPVRKLLRQAYESSKRVAGAGTRS